MLVVAQLVESQFVELIVAGSSPVGQPIFLVYSRALSLAVKYLLCTEG
jgi:hypothetical protein